MRLENRDYFISAIFFLKRLKCLFYFDWVVGVIIDNNKISRLWRIEIQAPPDALERIYPFDNFFFRDPEEPRKFYREERVLPVMLARKNKICLGEYFFVRFVGQGRWNAERVLHLFCCDEFHSWIF